MLHDEHNLGERSTTIRWRPTAMGRRRLRRFVALSGAIGLIVGLLGSGAALADSGGTPPPRKDRAKATQSDHRSATGSAPAPFGGAATRPGASAVHAPSGQQAGPLSYAARLVLSPRRTFATPGQWVAYTAVAFDASGRRIGDVTTRTKFSIAFTASRGSTARKDGSCSAATCAGSHLGRHTVMGVLTIGNTSLRGTAELQVVPKQRASAAAPPLATIEISPATATTVPGGQVTYVVLGYDRNHRPLGDVTARTAFSISPDGSCTGARCTATLPGRHTVTGAVRLAHRTITDQVDLFVTSVPVPTPPPPPSSGPTPPPLLGPTPSAPPGSMNRQVSALRIVGTASTIVAGGTVSYAATGLDRSGRPVMDLTAATVFAIAPPGRCDGRTCTATRAGTFVVVGTVIIPEGSFRGSTTLQVVPGSLDRLSLTPPSASVVAGSGVSFRASGADAFGNALGDVTGSTSFTISSPGRCTGSTCTATKAQQYTVRGSALVAGRLLAGTATVVVVPGPLAAMAISPSRVSVKAGEAVAFRAQGSDAYGNPVGDITDRATFAMTAPGTCTGDSCAATRAQEYVVTGSVVEGGREVVDTAVIDVSAGPLTGLQLDPSAAVVTPRAKVVFHAFGTDGFGNLLADASGSTTLTISPEGTCADDTCSASTVGPHVVTASADLGSDTVTTDAKLLVLATDIAGLRLNPRSAQIRPDQTATFTAVGVDGAGDVVVDLTGYTGFAITPDGQCTDNTCTAGALGKHEVTATLRTSARSITDVVSVEVVPKGRVPDQAPGEIANIQVSPKIAQADAGAGITYIATGVDPNGTPVADLTAQTTFTIRPDGSCAKATCVATTPGPHTVTGTFNGVFTAAASRGAGVTVSRSTSVRIDPRVLAAQTLTGEASLDVRAGPGSCLVSPADLKDLTAAPRPAGGGTASMQVHATFDPRFATCPVVVLVDDLPIHDVTTIGADGTVVAATTITKNPAGGSGTVEVTAIDGRAIKQVSYTIPVASQAVPTWLLWLLLALALVVAAMVANSARNRRQRRWVAQHVLVAPAPSQGSVSASRDPDSGPSLGIRLVPRSDPATTDITTDITTEEDR